MKPSTVLSRRRSKALGDPLLQEGPDLGDRDALLLPRVSVSNRHALVPERLTVDREAVRRAGLVHPRVALADRLLHVELGDEPVAYLMIELLGGLGHAVLVHEREDPRLDRRQRGVKL